jgi:GNAT superfamily N-acetyltransferase
MTPRVRSMSSADVSAAAVVGAAAFGHPLPQLVRPRIARVLATDPEGAFVAESDGRIIGLAQAIKRERLWCLSTLAVAPDVQSGGVGGRLLECALGYGSRTSDGLIVSSADPRALRLYALSGFSLRPTFEAQGEVDRRRLPRVGADVREGDASDLDALASISREVRGAAHTTELEFVLEQGVQLLRLRDRGFALVRPDRGPWLLVARDEEAAQTLLWCAIAASEETQRPSVRWITGDQQWAIGVVLEAGLALVSDGALCVRGRPGPLRPYLPTGAFA